MRKKILIVDDDPKIVRLLVIRLEVNEYKAFGAIDSYSCIKMANELKPDLILMDMQLPGTGGVATFEALKASVFTSMIPIIFISALPEKEVKDLIKDLGADGFFPKPFKIIELLKKIKKLIG